MRARQGIRRSAVAVSPETTVAQAAAVMERSGVGALAVVEGDSAVGIVTDRDLVRRVLATGMPSDGRVDSVMSGPVVTIDAEDDLHGAFELFRTHAIRRIGVVDGRRFIGMLSIDDLLIDLARDLADLARPVAAERDAPHRDSGTPAVR
jgi:CBS domain-containing protein